MTPLFNGLLLGFSIAAPVGPIGILCLRKTLTQGRSFGFVAGLGAASADAIYGSAAALGLTIISQFLIKYASWVQLVGALFLLFLAYRTFSSPVMHTEDSDISRTDYLRTFVTTFFLTLTNPLTILSFIGIFAGMNLASGSVSSVYLIVGVFLGSAAWWLLLSTVVGLLRKMIGSKTMKFINLFSSLILLSFGIYSMYSAYEGLVHP